MFKPRCLPILIGSLPLLNHAEAMELIFTHSPEIPLWPQLPKNAREGMVRQFLSGFPGIEDGETGFTINTDAPEFQEQMTSFYEEYLSTKEQPTLPHNSRFKLGSDTAGGFDALILGVQNKHKAFTTLKGQVTGPVTTGTGAKDHQDRGIFFDDNLRDMLIKHLALKARWQVEQYLPFTDDVKPIIFIDEPVIVSFGSSAFVGISKEMVTESVNEVILEIQEAGGLAGVHICANGDWGPVLSSTADIISFDAFFYFDSFILFKEQLITFLKRQGLLAWGIVPTGDPKILQSITSEDIFSRFKEQLHQLSSYGIPLRQLLEQTFIAPSCGTGSLSVELATKVLQLTREVSEKARAYLISTP